MADETKFSPDEPQELEFDLGAEMGAQAEPSAQCLTIYLPDRDREGKEIGNQRQWMLDAADLLALLGGGFTAQGSLEGGWYDQKIKAIVWDRPVMIYCYIKPELLRPMAKELRRFLHRLGRETKQGEVAFEFDGVFYRITQFDP